MNQSTFRNLVFLVFGLCLFGCNNVRTGHKTETKARPVEAGGVEKNPEQKPGATTPAVRVPEAPLGEAISVVSSEGKPGLVVAYAEVKPAFRLVAKFDKAMLGDMATRANLFYRFFSKNKSAPITDWLSTPMVKLQQQDNLLAIRIELAGSAAEDVAFELKDLILQLGQSEDAFGNQIEAKYLLQINEYCKDASAQFTNIETNETGCPF